MTDIPRTKAEAILDIRYGIKLHLLHSRLYRRLRAGVTVVSLLGGSAALVSVLRTMPHVLVAAGIAVAVASAADIVGGWADKAPRVMRLLRRRLAALLSRVSTLDLEALDSELAGYEADADDELESLRIPAYNDNARSNGHEGWIRPEPLSSRLIRLIAA